MAASAFTLYSNAALELSKGQMNLSSDTFVMALITNSCDLTGSGTITGSGGSFTVTVSGSGIFQLTHSP